MQKIRTIINGVRERRSFMISAIFAFSLLTIGTFIVEVTRSLGDIEKDLPRFGFFGAMELNGTRKDVANLRRGLEFVRSDGLTDSSRDVVAEAINILQIHLKGLEGSWLTGFIEEYDEWINNTGTVIKEIDIFLDVGFEDNKKLNKVIKSLENSEAAIERIYYQFGNNTYLALRSHQSQLQYLQWLILGLLGLLVVIGSVAAFVVIKRERSMQMQRAAEEMVDCERQRLVDAMDSLNDGFVLFDKEDRLTLCNQQYRDLYPHTAPFMKTGARFEELLRVGIEEGEYGDFEDDPEQFVLERLAIHQEADGRIIEQKFGDGRIIRISEKRTRDGGIVGTRSDITGLKQREEALAASEKRYRFLASYDSLTGLGNRAFFNDTLECMLETAPASEYRTIVLIMDLNGFKEINDAFGHKTGDEVLKIIANRLLSILPDGGMAARVGADQFAVAVSSFGEADAFRRLAEAITRIFDDEIVLGDQRLMTKATIGIAAHPDHADTADDLFSRADIALYRAKQDGHEGWQVYDPEISKQRANRRALKKFILRALRENEFDLALQPKLSLTTGEIYGVEALLRWFDPVRNVHVSPGEFIPVAESSNLILDIDRHVIRDSCRRAAAFREQYGVDLSIAVNLSGAHFRHEKLIDLVEETLESTGLDPKFLEIELTEGVLINDRKLSETLIDKLHDIGVKIALDDFGTGYSSLAYLRDLPLDRLKIDRSFVSRIENSQRDQNIVKAFVELGHNLDMKVIAEGVETMEQMKCLKKLGCDDIQGYFISRPLLFDDFGKWIVDRSWEPVMDDMNQQIMDPA